MTTTNPTTQPKPIPDDRLQPKLRALLQDLEALHTAADHLENELSPAAKADPKWRERRRTFATSASTMAGRVAKGLSEVQDTLAAIAKAGA